MMLARRVAIVFVAGSVSACGAWKTLRAPTEDPTPAAVVTDSPTVETEPALQLTLEQQGDSNGEAFGLGGDVCAKARDQALWTEESSTIRVSGYVSTPECMTKALAYDRATGELAASDCLNVPIDYEDKTPLVSVVLPEAQRAQLEAALRKLRGWRLPAACCEAVELRRLNPNNLAGARRVSISVDGRGAASIYAMSVDFDKVDAGEDCTLLHIGEAEKFQALEKELRSFAPGAPPTGE